MNKKYVVSADIYLLLKQWAATRGFNLPPAHFFAAIRQESIRFMSGIFPQFELVGEETLQTGIAEIMTQQNLPTISIDRVYSEPNFRIDSSRLYDEDLERVGYGYRDGTPNENWGLDEIKAAGIREAVLIDDVVYFGKGAVKAINRLKDINVKVRVVCCGIGIKSGIDVVEKEKVKVICVRRYDDVIDEICERDFYPGVPFSGMTLVHGQNTGIPYLLPLGKPNDWASIPDKDQLACSRFFLGQTIKLFEAIGAVSGRQVLCSDLERKVFRLPKDGTGFVEELKCLLTNLPAK